ncbi:MAG: prepilin-type N-terminal cleavage/methylation domain-containing protein [Oscillospiraceae bacterium]|nr:prepilin-type N-terminal cleavage/methylation domain-containing protein [Oscillospiraceae bacterium]
MRKKIRGKKGLTLVELIVSMMLLSIILIAVSSFFAPTLMTYFMANDLAEVNSLLNSLSSFIINDLESSKETAVINLSNASDFRVRANIFINYSVEDDTGTITGGNGYIMRNGQPVLPMGYYRNYTVSMSLEETAAGQYELILNLQRNGEANITASRSYTVTPLGLRP